MSGNLYKTWARRVDAWATGTAVPTHSQINRYRSIWEQVHYGHRYYSLTGEQAEAIVEQVEGNGPYAITEDHTGKGIAWIMGKSRQLQRELGVNALDIVTTLDRFTWTGRVHVVCDGPWRPALTPIWTIHLADGSTVEYAATPWQTGGIVEFWHHAPAATSAPAAASAARAAA